MYVGVNRLPASKRQQLAKGLVASLSAPKGFTHAIPKKWFNTICWGLETIQKIRHVGSDFFYTWIGLTYKERSHVSIES
jgi:uncharacterized ferritin-like protein (DUF455 family)